MILKGKLTVLRPITLKDAPRFVRWLADPAVNKFTTRSKATLKEEVKWIRGLPKAKNSVNWAIDTKEGVHIGSIGLEFNKQDKRAIYDILIGDKQYWSKGYGYDATKTLLDYAFKKLKLHRVSLSVYAYNERAIKLYEKLGFKKFGIGRENIYYHHKFYNCVYMDMLNREWRAKG